MQTAFVVCIHPTLPEQGEVSLISSELIHSHAIPRQHVWLPWSPLSALRVCICTNSFFSSPEQYLPNRVDTLSY